jgi:hypothetical protein
MGVIDIFMTDLFDLLSDCIPWLPGHVLRWIWGYVHTLAYSEKVDCIWGAHFFIFYR